MRPFGLNRRFCVFAAALQALALFSACSSPSSQESALGAQIIGSWEVTGEGGYRGLLSFLPDGEFGYHEASAFMGFEMPPLRLVSGRWSLVRERIRLRVVESAPGMDPWREMGDLDVSISGDRLRAIPSAEGEMIELMRTNWMPDPIPPDAARRPYYQNLNGVCRIELLPERNEGRLGDRIPVQVIVTNTGAVSLPVPLRLADRIYLRDEYLDYRDDDVVGLRIDFDDMPDMSEWSIESVLLEPGDQKSFTAYYILGERQGRYRIRPVILGDHQAELGDAVIRVLPPTGQI